MEVEMIAAQNNNTTLMVPHSLFVVAAAYRGNKGPAYLDKVRAITDSIIANGYDSNYPILVTPVMIGGIEVFFILDGHARHDAAILARKQGAPAIRVPVRIQPAQSNLPTPKIFAESRDIYKQAFYVCDALQALNVIEPISNMAPPADYVAKLTDQLNGHAEKLGVTPEDLMDNKHYYYRYARENLRVLERIEFGEIDASMVKFPAQQHVAVADTF
jgi:hypothetical protein